MAETLIRPWRPIDDFEVWSICFAFLHGVDSPHHSPESRAAWISLFRRDATNAGIDPEPVIALVASPTTPAATEETRT